MKYLGNFGDIDYLQYDGFFVFYEEDKDCYLVVYVQNLYELLPELDHDKWRVWVMRIFQEDITEYFGENVARCIGLDKKEIDTYPVELKIRAIVDYYGPDRFLEEEYTFDIEDDVINYLKEYPIDELMEAKLYQVISKIKNTILFDDIEEYLNNITTDRKTVDGLEWVFGSSRYGENLYIHIPDDYNSVVVGADDSMLSYLVDIAGDAIVESYLENKPGMLFYDFAMYQIAYLVLVDYASPVKIPEVFEYKIDKSLVYIQDY